jgi:hypothetical protein
MSTVGRALGFAAGLLWFFWGEPARAQDGAAAQALFEQGVRELEAGRFAQACPALAESQRLDPHPGTLFALAECEAKSGKIASAVGHYQDYLGLLSRMSAEQLERHAERAATARAQVEALKSQVPTLSLVLPAAAPADLIVERDGMRLQGPALGAPLPIDPGEHVIVTRLASGAEMRVILSVAIGEAKTLELTLPEAPPAAAPAAPPAGRELEPRRKVDPLRTWAWAIGGVGLAGVAAGSVTGIIVLQKKATVTDHCVGNVCDDVGKEAGDTGKTLAAVSTVSFGIGLTAVATSIALLIATEPRKAALPLAPRLLAGRDGVWAGLEKSF